VSSAFERLLRGINLERKRMMLLVPRAKSFTDLLKEENPEFVCRDGTKYVVDKEDLNRLRAMLSDEEAKLLRLPVFIKPAGELGGGFYKIVGSSEDSKTGRVVSKLVFTILGTAPRAYLYGYEVQRLKRTIPSLVFVMY